MAQPTLGLWSVLAKNPCCITLTLFSDQAVVPVIRVVGVTKTTMGVLKLQEFMTVFA